MTLARLHSVVRSVGALALGALAACVDKPWHGIVMDPPSAAPPLMATSVGGGATTLASAKGDVVVLYFGYTHCPDVCPTTMADWARAKRTLGADTTRVRFIFVSVDPGRDTPEIAEAYVHQFDAGFIGLSTSDAQLAIVRRDWGVPVYPEGDPRTSDYSVAHPAHTYVVDREGRTRLMIPPGTRGEEIAADLRRLR